MVHTKSYPLRYMFNWGLGWSRTIAEGSDAAMYAVIQRFNGSIRSINKIKGIMTDELVSFLKNAAGFEAYYLFVGEDGSLVLTTIFDDYRLAMRAKSLLREWMTAKIKDEL